MNEGKAKVTINVEGLGKQELYMPYEEAKLVYVAAGQNIMELLLGSLYKNLAKKEEHHCSCGGHCDTSTSEALMNIDTEPGELKQGVIMRERFVGHVGSPEELEEKIANFKTGVSQGKPFPLPTNTMGNVEPRDYMRTDVDPDGRTVKISRRIDSPIDTIKVACKIELPEEVTDNINKAKESVNDLVEEKKWEKVSETLEAAKDCMKEFVTKKCEEKKAEEKEEIDVDYYNKRADILNNNPFTHEMFQKAKLVAYKCPDCGEVTVRWLTLGASNITYCHFCKSEPIVIETVDLTKTICEKCFAKTILYAANGLDTMECSKCKSPIDLFRKKDGLLVSANKIGQHRKEEER